MQFFLSANRAQDKVLCVFVVFSSLLSLFHLWISVMLSELDEIAAGFSLLCLAYALLCLWEEPGLNEGADLCQRLSARVRGGHTRTHSRLALCVFFCCKG